ncbi:MAG TPA: Ig-like domain-containing protein, partial [Thermoplasmata archaeon]|nr:Ig-like domain-containing protein [Thermoplasmata archaeon]
PNAGAGIIPHSAIPNPNDCSKGGGTGGHWDPGPNWDWTKYMDYIRKHYNGGPQHGAQHAGDSYPATMEAGKQHVVWSEFVNNGTATWTPGGASPFRLGTAAPQDRPSEFETPGNWMTSNRPTDVDSRTDPGATGRYTFIMTAPKVHNKTYAETWQLLQEGITWFGPEITYSVTVVDTLPPFQAPSLVSPGDGAPIDQADVKFTWTAADDNGSGIKEYDLVVSRSDDPGDQGSFVKLQTVNESTFDFTLTGLPDGKLYWWVGARDHGANQVLSPVWPFTVDAHGPTAAVPRSPADGAFVNSPAVELKWDPASDAGGIKEYLVSVSQSADITDKSKMVREERVDGATISLSVAGLPEGRLYWWVSASDNSNHSSASSVFSFTKDTLPPKVAESTPAAGAKVKEVTKVSVKLTEELDPAQPVAGLLKLYGPDQKELPFTVVVSGSEVSVTSAAALSPGDYRAVLSKDARDRAGNALGAPHGWTFSVEDNKTGGGTEPGSPMRSLMQPAGPLLVWQWVVLAAALVATCLLIFLRTRRRASKLRPTVPPGENSSNGVTSPPNDQTELVLRE